MAYELLKDQSYDNLGGINLKASVYTTGQNQVLDLRNYCFERPGAWTSRAGTIDGASFPIAQFGVTPTSLYQLNYPEYENASIGASFYVFDSAPIGSSTVNMYLANAVTTIAISSSLVAGAFDFSAERTPEYTGTLATYLYFANGNNFKVWSKGITNSILAIWGYTGAIEYRFSTPTNITSVSLGPFGLTTGFIPSGTHVIKIMFGKNFDGRNGIPFSDDFIYWGPESQPFYFNQTPTLPVMNRSFQGSVPVPQGVGYNIATVKYTSPVGGIEYTFPSTSLGTVFLVTTASTVLNFNFPPFSGPAFYDSVSDFTLTPRYLESYKNMLFSSGFSSSPSEVYYSDLGRFLFFDDSFRISVQPGIGKEITGLKKFQDTLIIFKDTAIFELSGNSPETLSVKTVTEEYGCVNNRASVTFKTKLWFVDQKGICEYNGPDTYIVSYPVQDYFNQLDIKNISAMNVKGQKQLWFSDPSGTTLVYDYDEEAWSIFDKLPIDATVGSESLEYGSSLPMASWFNLGASYLSLTRQQNGVTTDRGLAITLMARTRFHKRMGETTEEMWRRLFVDMAYGATVGPTMTVNYFKNYGVTIAETRFINFGQFQERIDFGIPARSISMQFISNVTMAATINGYTIEGRYLRSV